MSTRTASQSVRYAIGALLMLGGVVCLGWGFSTFTGSALDGGGDGAGRSMALFAGGALATVVGFGLVAFTRAGALTSSGGYTRVTYERGFGAAPAGRSQCTACGAAVDADDRFCGSCGTALARAGQA